jgi:PIN domain nuclease of toxin-antitoxin system
MGSREVIVLDTHAFVWWVGRSSRLSALARRTIAASTRRGLAAISLWEISMLVERGRLKLDRDVGDWLSDAVAEEGVEVLELSSEIAVRSTRLAKTFHGDPADQLIVATAIVHACPLVTRDERITRFGGVRTIVA